MTSIEQVRKLAVETAGTQEVHVSIDENDYGWHVIIRGGQPEVDELGYVSFSSVEAPVMAAASSNDLGVALAECYQHLTERLVKQEMTP